MRFPPSSGSVFRCALVAAVTCATSIAQGRTLLLDEVVAVVELGATAPTRSVLLSEVELSARIDRALEQGADSLSVTPDAAALQKALSAYVDRLVVVGEAQRLEVFQLDEQATDKAVAAFIDALGREAFEAWLASTGHALETVREAVLQRARVGRYLEGRFRVAARPRAAQVRERLEELRAAGTPASQAQVERQLEEQRFEELVAQYVADVRRRVRVRVLRDFDAYGFGSLVHGTATAPQLEGHR